MSVRDATRALRGLAVALGDFLRGFLGLAGTPGAAPRTERGDPAAARRALEERAARRPGCC